MNINSAFKSKFLKGAEMDEDETYTINRVEEENVAGANQPEEVKPIVYFEETEKGLVLNRTNSNVIQELYGPETDDWTGKKITLFQAQVDYQGKPTLAIRVRMKKPSGGAAKPAASQPPGNGGATKPRTTAWTAFCDATPSFEQDKRSSAWTGALKSMFPTKKEKDLTNDDWTAFATNVAENYSEAEEDFIPV